MGGEILTYRHKVRRLLSPGVRRGQKHLAVPGTRKSKLEIVTRLAPIRAEGVVPVVANALRKIGITRGEIQTQNGNFYLTIPGLEDEDWNREKIRETLEDEGHFEIVEINNKTENE